MPIRGMRQTVQKYVTPAADRPNLPVLGVELIKFDSEKLGRSQLYFGGATMIKDFNNYALVAIAYYQFEYYALEGVTKIESMKMVQTA